MIILIIFLTLFALFEFFTSWTWRRFYYRKIYLRSKHWRRLRAQVAHRASFTCERKGCAAYGQNLDVHHKTYERIGHERLDDLVYLCRTDHKRVENGQMVLLKSGEWLSKWRQPHEHRRTYNRTFRR